MVIVGDRGGRYPLPGETEGEAAMAFSAIDSDSILLISQPCLCPPSLVRTRKLTKQNVSSRDQEDSYEASVLLRSQTHRK